MGESWISVLAMVAFFILPIILGNKGKGKKKENTIEEFLSELGFDQEDLIEEVEAVEAQKDKYESPQIKEVSVNNTHTEKPDADNNAELIVGKGMSREEKKKLVIYSEVMSPKYKEY